MPLSHNLPRPTPTPHTLQQAIPLRQPIQTIIPLSHRPHEATQRIDLVLARVAPVLIHLPDGDLHGGVVFGFDDAVRGGAFAGDVARGGLVRGGWRRGGVGDGCEGGGGRDVQVDDLAFLIFHGCGGG